MSVEDDFYVVIASDDSRLYRHGTDTTALAEATRLAGMNPHKKFYICRAFKVAKVAPNVVIEDTDLIPF